ncbi:hypothetical protein [Thermomonospora umbrina]|uniref:Uncharacterized protein n=1 Tax=Thermomonospora umbrina TaxID=111806 RepID=A0A3D9SYQ6_9ACTN|nr:hypothetical protein [Thermomonospora umbrina]REE97704.1 hypothetical protein DFJ69_3178 [Thermomonospora umbrina]
MLKRLATAGVLTVAVGGVLMSATPAMAGGHGDYTSKKYSDNDSNFSLDYSSHKEKDNVDNETLAIANCLQIPIIPIISPPEQDCYIGNVEND